MPRDRPWHVRKVRSNIDSDYSSDSDWKLIELKKSISENFIS